MRVEVRRKTESAKSIIGEMWVDDQFECFTLEPARKNPAHPGHPCIVAGEYPLYLTFSPHFKMVTPEVMDVPGRSQILIHPGNFPKDSKGCTLVGESKVENAIYGSKQAFKKLLTLLRTATDHITIVYTDPEK